MRIRFLLAVVSLVAAGVLGAIPAGAHVERPIEFPQEPGEVPAFRKGGPSLLVCKNRSTLRAIEALPKKAERRNTRLFEECREDGYRHIQAAIDAVRKQGSRILILPGTYREHPTAGPPPAECAGLESQRPLSYEDQRRCRTVDNLVSVFGDSDDPDRVCDLPVCRLQIQGTGNSPDDVILDNDFAKLNALRADRADGIYLRNFTVQNSEFNAVYFIELDGFVIDRMVGRWNDEYGFLTFATDHGLYTNCEAYGNGDGGLYPGAATDVEGRYAIEIRNCNTHHNLIGISGTAGNNLYVHDNLLHHNTLGADEDSFFPDHPGMPQDGSLFVNNHIYSNNEDYNQYWEDGTCRNVEEARRRYPEGVVCPTLPAPIGTGVLVLGGNDNTIQQNYIYDNWRAGALQVWIPATFRNENDPAKQHDTSHFNRYVDNWMGVTPSGEAMPNGVDFYWDVEGRGNCWSGNKAAPGRSITSDPETLPSCPADPNVMYPGPLVSVFASCAAWSREEPNPPGCTWVEKPAKPS